MRHFEKCYFVYFVAIHLTIEFGENQLQRRYTRVNSQGGSLYGGPGPEYDDPANCAEEDQYGSQYGAPYDHYGSRRSVGE